MTVPTSSKPFTVMALRHGGTHLILPLVKGLTGTPLYRPKGTEALICRPNGPLVIFIRNPRNWLVSFYRWKRGNNVDDAGLAAFMVAVKHEYMSPIAYLAAWSERWMRTEYEPRLLIRFENIVPRTFETMQELDEMQRFLGSSVDAIDLYSRVFGAGNFTGRHSVWQEWFGPLTTGAYLANGGADIDRLMGYDNE